jgi:hypothetical protein
MVIASLAGGHTIKTCWGDLILFFDEKLNKIDLQVYKYL